MKPQSLNNHENILKWNWQLFYGKFIQTKFLNISHLS